MIQPPITSKYLSFINKRIWECGWINKTEFGIHLIERAFVDDYQKETELSQTPLNPNHYHQFLHHHHHPFCLFCWKYIGIIHWSGMELSRVEAGLDSLTQLQPSKKVKALILHANSIASLLPIFHFPNLIFLDISSNALSSTTGLIGCPLLNYLNVSNNLVASISVLEAHIRFIAWKICHRSSASRTYSLLTTSCPRCVIWLHFMGMLLSRWMWVAIHCPRCKSFFTFLAST